MKKYKRRFPLGNECLPKNVIHKCIIRVLADPFVYIKVTADLLPASILEAHLESLRNTTHHSQTWFGNLRSESCNTT